MTISNRISSSLISSLKFCTNSHEPTNKLLTLKLTRVFTHSDVADYSKVTLDLNPLHFYPDSARTAGFRDPIVHGMLVASLFPRIISAHFPGAVYISQSLQFKQPVYIGEEICGEVQATTIRNFKEKYMVKFTTKCFKQDRLLVLDGEATAILPTTATATATAMHLD